jgi:hypothetical protein
MTARAYQLETITFRRYLIDCRALKRDPLDPEVMESFDFESGAWNGVPSPGTFVCTNENAPSESRAAPQ